MIYRKLGRGPLLEEPSSPPEREHLCGVHEAGERLAHVRSEIVKALWAGAPHGEVYALLLADEDARQTLKRALQAEKCDT